MRSYLILVRVCSGVDETRKGGITQWCESGHVQGFATLDGT